MKQLGRQSPTQLFFIYNREQGKRFPLAVRTGDRLICNRLHPKYGCKVTKGKLILFIT